MKTITSTLLLIAALGDVAWGNAFNVNEHEARVAGRGGATAASNTEASSIAFNPGGIPIGEGTQITLNSTLYFADGTFEPTTFDTADGAPAGEYVVTIEWRKLVNDRGEWTPGPNLLPAKYGDPSKSDVVVKIAAGQNDLPPIALPMAILLQVATVGRSKIRRNRSFFARAQGLRA